MSGWVKLHRTLLDHELWTSEPFTRGQAWVDLILLSNHKPGYIRVRGMKVQVNPGQVGWSVKRLATRWQWSRGKVQRFLDELENEHQIEQQKNNVSSLLSLTKWNEFQETDTRIDTRRTPDGHQTDTNKNDKNEKKDIISEFLQLDTPEFRAAWEKKKQHRRELGLKQYTPTGMRTLFGKMVKWGVRNAIIAIDESIAANHQGIFQPNNNNGKATYSRDKGTLNDGAYATEGIDELF